MGESLEAGRSIVSGLVRGLVSSERRADAPVEDVGAVAAAGGGGRTLAAADARQPGEAVGRVARANVGEQHPVVGSRSRASGAARSEPPDAGSALSGSTAGSVVGAAGGTGGSDRTTWSPSAMSAHRPRGRL